MNAARIKQRITSIRTELDDLEKALDDIAAGEAGADPIYQTVEEYAGRSHVSTDTVRRWLRAGLPCVRRGRVVRIKVAEADAWTPAEERARSAQHAAHRGHR